MWVSPASLLLLEKRVAVQLLRSQPNAARGVKEKLGRSPPSPGIFEGMPLPDTKAEAGHTERWLAGGASLVAARGSTSPADHHLLDLTNLFHQVLPATLP